jgi:hypothetical protein
VQHWPEASSLGPWVIGQKITLARSCAVFRGERGWGAQWERAGGCVQIHRGLWESAHHNAEPDLT